jgi:hypothetical protein
MATQVDLGKIRPVWKGDWAASTAYEQNDMVKVGVDSYICTAAHTSGSTFADTNWDILALGAELPAQSGNAGKVLVTDGTNLSWGQGGKLIGVDVFTNNNRVALSNAVSTELWSASFNKVSSTSYILAHGIFPFRGSVSYYDGIYFTIDGANKGTDGSAYYGVNHGFPSDAEAPHMGIVTKGFIGLSSGSHSFNFGWSTRGSVSTNKPANQWNPNSSDDNRMHQQASQVIIYEMEP